MNNELPRYGAAFDICCPHCGRAAGTYSRTEYRYGSPIKVCKKCGNKYINPFYHEMAIDGVAPAAFNYKAKVKAMIILAVIFVLALLLHLYEMNFSDYYHTAPIVILIVVPLCILYLIGDMIYTKSGMKMKRTQKKFAESVERLKNKDYVRELIAYGYDVPAMYREGIEPTEASRKGQNL